MSLQLYRKTFATAIAEFTVICDNNNIIRLSFENDNYAVWQRRYLGEAAFFGENELCRRCEHEISLYLTGSLKEFDLPVKLYGTPFQLKIWRTLLQVPYGKTVSYAGISALAGEGGARSAGGALAKNPVPIILPCHRVIRADGALGGFCGGYTMSDTKRALLTLEGAAVNPS